MTVEVMPIGTACNLKCRYCYQGEDQRCNVHADVGTTAVMATLDRIAAPFVLFGGEPLMLPEEELESMLAYGFGKYGRNTIQTNGTLVNDRHLQMFGKYDVHVGVSIDGPGSLNDPRWAGSLQKTREATRRSENALRRLVDANIPVSIITTLHRSNAHGRALKRLCRWFEKVDTLGIGFTRLHVPQITSEIMKRDYALSNDELFDALMTLLRASRGFKVLEIDIFEDMRALLDGRDKSATCVWCGCDPASTPSVTIILPDGSIARCGRMTRCGATKEKATRVNHERCLTLFHKSREDHGCAGCRFFLMCKGHCPATAMEGNIAGRSEHCSLWYRLYEHFEEESILNGHEPLSRSPVRPALENLFLRCWEKGLYPSMERLLPHARKETVIARFRDDG